MIVAHLNNNFLDVVAQITWSKRMKMLKKWCVLLSFCIAGGVEAQMPPVYFDLDTACRISQQSGSVNLRNDGNIVASLSRDYCAMLIQVRTSIAAQAGLYPKFLISTENELNAYATSDSGQALIVFTVPMLKRLGQDKDAIAAIVGHEIAHLKLNHRASKTTANVLFELLGALAGAALDAKIGGTTSSVGGIGRELGNLGSQLASRAFSRSAEIEADELGVRWIISAGFDPEGAIRLHRDVIPASYSLLSTHPASGDRQERINAVVANVRSGFFGSKAGEIQTASASPRGFTSRVNNKDGLAGNASEQKGQAGVIIGIKERYKYVILSGISQAQLHVGDKVEIISSNGKRFETNIARAIDGYYSAIVSTEIETLRLGDRVNFYSSSKEGQ